MRNINIVQGCLLQAVRDGEVSVLVHQANCFHTFGAGIAKAIAQQYPEAYQADLHTVKGSKEKMGTYSLTHAKNQDCLLVNMYSQYRTSSSSQQTDYTAMAQALEELSMHLPTHTGVVIGIPYGMGCGLGGGDWDVVYPLICQYLRNYPVRIYKLHHSL